MSKPLQAEGSDVLACTLFKVLFDLIVSFLVRHRSASGNWRAAEQVDVAGDVPPLMWRSQ